MTQMLVQQIDGTATAAKQHRAPRPKKKPVKPKPVAKPRPAPKPKPEPSTASLIVAEAHKLLGITEYPTHSNSGPGVRMIQSATGAYGAPWCVSTVQFILVAVLGHTIANRTANAYYLASFGAQQGWIVSRPVVGGPVVYHIGAGHAGTVVQVLPDGSFYAIEGNEMDSVRLMHRDPRTIRCTFLKPDYLK